MIKGCSRKVIVIKNPGSNLFEEAYFIVSPREAERKYGDFLVEANRIIASKAVPHICSKKNKGNFIPWVLGFLAGAAASFPLGCLLF